MGNMVADAKGKYQGRVFFLGRGDVGEKLEKRKPWIVPTEKEHNDMAMDLAKQLEIDINKLPKEIFRQEINLAI
jgi:hypothetical protein